MGVYFFLYNSKTISYLEKEVKSLMQTLKSFPHDKDALSINEKVIIGSVSSKNKSFEFFVDGRLLNFVGEFRLDNKEELRTLLCESKEISDTELILKLYLHQGEGFVNTLLGDFSFCIYDSKEDKVVCVRDYRGIKLLYYYQSEEFFITSDSIEVILVHPKISSTLNDNIIQEWLLNTSVFNQNDTFVGTQRIWPPRV
ncbi:MAG: hypothetical protein U5K55_07060, partial [Aliarcobacter sp.]|nr:hypothetical protein [Aliarcobacter sp.]